MQQHRWKSYLGMSAMIALLVGAPGVASSQALVASTVHNLSASAGAGQANYGQVCLYCHAPHNTVLGAPLWNKVMTTSVFTMYNGTNSATMDMVVGMLPGRCRRPASRAMTARSGSMSLPTIRRQSHR